MVMARLSVFLDAAVSVCCRQRSENSKKNNNSHSRIYAAKRCTNFSFSRFYHGNGNDDDLRLICLWESEELDNADGGEPTSMPVPAVPVPCKA